MSSYTVTNNEHRDGKFPYSSTEFFDMHRVSDRIILSGYDLGIECQEFLDENGDVSLEIPKIVEIANQAIEDDVRPIFNMIKDGDNFSDYRLAISFNIQNKSYDDILDMWMHVSEKIYKEISPAVAKKIAILLDDGK